MSQSSEDQFVNAVQCAWQAGRGYGPFPLRAEILAGKVNPLLVSRANAVLHEIAAQRER